VVLKDYDKYLRQILNCDNVKDKVFFNGKSFIYSYWPLSLVQRHTYCHEVLVSHGATSLLVTSAEYSMSESLYIFLLFHGERLQGMVHWMIGYPSQIIRCHMMSVRLEEQCQDMFHVQKKIQIWGIFFKLGGSFYWNASKNQYKG